MIYGIPYIIYCRNGVPRMKKIQIELLNEREFEVLEEVAENCHMNAEELIQKFVHELVTDELENSNRKMLLTKWILEIFRIR